MNRFYTIDYNVCFVTIPYYFWYRFLVKGDLVALSVGALGPMVPMPFLAYSTHRCDGEVGVSGVCDSKWKNLNAATQLAEISVFYAYDRSLTSRLRFYYARQFTPNY